MPSHRAAGVTIVTDDLQHAARHAAPTASAAAGGGGGAPRVVQPKWIFDQICPSARADMAPEGTGGSEPRAETPPPGAGAPESAEESDDSDGFSEEY